jgi:hypothetical protein
MLAERVSGSLANFGRNQQIIAERKAKEIK